MFGDSQSDDCRYHQFLYVTSCIGLKASIPGDRMMILKAKVSDSQKV
jgi:hypothetical protein